MCQAELVVGTEGWLSGFKMSGWDRVVRKAWV